MFVRDVFGVLWEIGSGEFHGVERRVSVWFGLIWMCLLLLLVGEDGIWSLLCFRFVYEVGSCWESGWLDGEWRFEGGCGVEAAWGDV